MDGTGRILVPPALRDYAGLDHHVVLVGQGNKFELWDDAKWQQEPPARSRSPAAACRPTSTASSLDGWR